MNLILGMRPTRPLNIDDILAFESFEGFFIPILDISPDRTRIAVSVTSGPAGRPCSPRPFLWGADLGRLHIVDIETGCVRAVTGPDGAGMTSPLWSPDSKRVAAIAAHRDWLRLCVITAEDGRVETVADRDLVMDFAQPPSFRWIDDDTIALLLVPPGQRAAGIAISTCTTEGAPAAWAAMQAGQCPTANVLTVEQGATRRSPHEPVLVSLADLTVSPVGEENPAHPVLAALASDERSPRDPDTISTDMRAAERQLWHDTATGERIAVVRGNIGTELLWINDSATPRTLLRINTHLSDVRIGNAFELRYELSNGRTTTMRCVLPPDWQDGDRRPAVMFVYPALNRATNPDAPLLVEGPNAIYNAHLFAAQGYVVLDPNLPFDEGIDDDLIDSVVTGVGCALDAAEKASIVDRNDVHAFGQSAGGWAVMALLAKTRHFRSGISMAGIADLVAFHGQLDPRWRYKSAEQAEFYFADMCEGFFRLSGPPWKDPATYIRNSPIFHADRHRTLRYLLHAG
ncbi:S9 family peptidase [Burkholderia anthina]|uniref:S9 family peptidase n=1 Tax=Burkholderia anthina TaxID=179879 RepID=UPI001588964F|nr:prolyl oligopeptidase family serine peptidase [Burkholderia anthina]